MNEKILHEALAWYESQGKDLDVDLEDFVDVVVHKTADAIFDELKTELKHEFDMGNLKHPFVISSDYYLDLKLKEIKEKCISMKLDVSHSVKKE